MRALSCGASVAASSVEIVLSSEIAVTVPSAHVYVSYTITNKTATQITSATLVFDIAPASTTGQSVQRFAAAKQINVSGGTVVKGGSVWNVPLNMPSGEYVITATLVPQNLSLSAALYESAIARATLPMGITGGVQSAAFAPHSLRVADVAYNAQSIASLQGEGDVPVSIQVLNTGTGPYIGAVTWRLYAYEASEGSPPLAETKMPVSIHPSASTTLTYTLPANMRGAYMLEAELSDNVSSLTQRAWLAREGSEPSNCAHPTSSSTTRTLYNVALGIVSLLAAGALWRFFVVARRTQHIA